MRVLERSSSNRELDVGNKGAPSKAPWRKCIAIAVVVIMVASAFALFALSKSKEMLVPDDDTPAQTEVGGGTRSITYEVSRIGESYMKSTDPSKLGRHDHTVSGINDWFDARLTIYNDTIINKNYPCIVAYTPYSDRLDKPPKYDLAAFTVHSYYQLKVDAENITALATGANLDPWIMPIMGDVADDGGWVNMSMYITYLTPTEFTSVQAGTHYANSYFGVDSTNITDYFKGYADDGWFAEIQGYFEYDRNAAKKFLGLTGADLEAAFNAVGADQIAWKWRQEWIDDGDAGKPLDIWAAYDYSILAGNAPGPYVHLKLDSINSTADKIYLWLWSESWGAEVLYARYLDKVGVNQHWKSWGEDWYLNGTLSPTNGDVQERLTGAYHMTAWKDPEYFVTTWMLEPQHDDYTHTTLAHLGWKSYYDPYYWGQYGASYNPTRIGWLPGQSFYGKEVHYWNSPMNWNLTADQRLVIKLQTNKPGGGIEPYWSAYAGTPYGAKTELLSHLKWGEMVLGHGYPSKLYSTTYYNAATKTITIQGPNTFAQNPNHNPTYTRINETGSPVFMLDITPVSRYDLTIDEAGPYTTGTTYTLRVTPKNFTNVAVTDWNGTVNLVASSNITLGASSHTFTGSEASWATTIMASAAGTFDVKSADSYFYLDVADSFPFTFGGATFTLSLIKGWNFVTVPYAGGGYKASNLPGLAMMDSISLWNVATQTYIKTYIKGVTPPSGDFTLDPSCGYWINVGANRTCSLSLGSIPAGPQTRIITIPAATGWVNLGFCTLNPTWKASQVVAMYSGTVQSLSWYNPVTKVYKTYIKGVPPSDFTLTPGQAYWVSVSGGGTFTYTP